MTIFTEEPKDSRRRRTPTIITVAGALAVVLGAALKYGPAPVQVAFAQRPAPTLEDVRQLLEVHQEQMVKINEAQQRSSERQERLLERLCIVASVNAGARPEECAR